MRAEKRMVIGESSARARPERQHRKLIFPAQPFTCHLCKTGMGSLGQSNEGEAFPKRLTARSEAVARHMAILAYPHSRRGGGLHIDRLSPHAKVPWRRA
jgi:hypothetical protein